jgi:hypothetical protein
MGRPIEFNNSVTERAKQYLSQCVDTVDSELIGKLKVKLPSIEGLANFLDIDYSTVYEWKKTYPEFSYIVDKVKFAQFEKLVDNGLAGSYNASIAKLILSKHGYSEKQEIQHSGDESNPITIKRIERVIVDSQ